MAFVKSKGLDWILRNIQQNVYVPFHTVHDEVDVIMDSNLIEGLAKRSSEIGAMKKVFDKIGTGFIDFVYDIEFSKDGSWIPSDSLPIYNLPCSKDEDLAIQRCKETSIEPETITLELDNLKEFKKGIEYDPINGVIVCLKTPQKTITSKNLISRSYVEKFMNNDKIEEVEELE